MAENKSIKSAAPKASLTQKPAPPAQKSAAKPVAANTTAKTVNKLEAKPSKTAPKLVDSKARNAPDKPAAKKSESFGAKKTPALSPDKVLNSPTPRPFIEPEKFGHMLHDRRAWIDEVVAIVVIVSGLVSLLSLFNSPPSATLASNWADLLRSLFGQGGAALISVMIMAVGLLIILPKVGVHVPMSWRRVISLEVAFLAFLALLHLAAHDSEPRALARAGGGGGYIGWALSGIVAKLFGTVFSLTLSGAILIISIAVALGIRRSHLRSGLVWLQARLSALAERLTREPPPKPILAAEPVYAAPATASMSAPVLSTPPISAVPTVEPASDPAPIVKPPTSKAAPKSAAPMARPASATFVPPPPEIIFPESEVQPPPQPAVPETVPKISAPASSIPARDSIVTRGARPVLPRAEDVPRHTRRFTVADFKEVRMPLKRSADLPPMDILNDVELNRPTEQEINTNVRIIENTLLEFDIDVEIVDVKVGPTVTQYAVQPFREVTNEQGQVVMQRVRVNKIASLSSDLALALSAKTLRIQPYVPGHTYMGIEVPNRTPSIVALRPVMESETFSRAFTKKDTDNPNTTVDLPLVVPLGRDVSGVAFVADLATMPHLLIAGTTGSGKSVCITAMTLALVMNNTPERLKLVMLDPKMVELTRFNGLPHLLGPVETDIERIIGVLRWATREMDRRYKLLEVEATRNIEAYNRALGKRRKAEHLPYIVILIDEIGDLMLTRPEEMERTLTRLAQMARAVGMHLVVATQRPSVDIITGLIKANFPARLSFAVASGIDSRVILDTVGAETLMGRGDMLYQASDASGPQRLQGCYVSDQELDQIVAYWKQWQIDQVASGNQDASGVAPWERGMTRRESLVETDPVLEEAIAMVIRDGEASASAIQRQLGIDFPRAAHIMDMLQDLGALGATKADGRTREVIIKPGTDRYKKLINQRKQ